MKIPKHTLDKSAAHTCAINNATEVREHIVFIRRLQSTSYFFVTMRSVGELIFRMNKIA